VSDAINTGEEYLAAVHDWLPMDVCEERVGE